MSQPPIDHQRVPWCVNATISIPIIDSPFAWQLYKCTCAHSWGSGMFCYIHLLWFQISLFTLMQVFIVFSILTSLLLEVLAVALLKGIILDIGLYMAFFQSLSSINLYIWFFFLWYILLNVQFCISCLFTCWIFLLDCFSSHLLTFF